MSEHCSIRTKKDDGTMTIRLGGEIDVASRRDLLSVVADSVFGDRPERVVIDLTDTTFVDSSGIALLSLACHAADSVGADYEVTAGPRTVTRVLELSGVRWLDTDHHR
jgi:anti-sigma B factor antagonist